MSSTIECARKVSALLQAGGILSVEDETAQILRFARDDVHALALANDRAAGIPLAYLVGVQPFLGIELLADRGVLVPRAETELLARTALQFLGRSHSSGLRIVDMCCGAGNLACLLALKLPACHVWAGDISERCVALTRRNVARLKLEQKVEVHGGDFFSAFAGLGLEETIDSVVCNPPYIPTGKLEKERKELTRHEPAEAFDGGPYGISAHLRLLREAPKFLHSAGLLMCEFGQKQGAQIQGLVKLAKSYERYELICDESGEPRVLVAFRR